MSDQPCKLTRRQVRRVDERAVHDLRIPSLILMENAGKNAADCIHRRFGADSRLAHVFSGTGNNGGDGFVIARHLHNRGWAVRVYIVGDAGRMTADAAANHAILRGIGLPMITITSVAGVADAAAAVGKDDVVVDALLGTGFSGAVREPAAAVIRGVNDLSVRAVVAVDVPSGLDCDSGAVGNVAVRADVTVTFVARKTGFDLGDAGHYVGEVVVVDIGAPPSLIERVVSQDLG